MVVYFNSHRRGKLTMHTLELKKQISEQKLHDHIYIKMCVHIPIHIP